MSKRKASDSPDIEHSSTESGVVPSSSKSSSKKKKTLSPDEVIAKALKKVSSSEAPSAKSVQQMLTRATVVGEEVMRETAGGMKPKTLKKGKGKAKADESEVQTRLVESIGMIILGLEVNPIFQEQVKAGVRDDGALAVWVPFFQTQKDLNAQVTAMTDQELLKPLPLCDSITPTTTHDELTELLREYFPSVFDNLDRLAIGRPACKYAPFVLCSKIPKGGYQPLQQPYPDGAAIARLFGKRGSNVERRVFFGNSWIWKT
ncbi:hypothetical protein CPB83DRAFT_151708 [Crepidotus variabilis]|uniref:Uncharacterized protein n=1 Tax=Crepidotus variabilis TaxID=179855 RepID=A0A9P6JI25_9AGAR|nr:hypothetical protein CPB83DRAFT_151708 [Crepidotus variabilis]